MNLLRIKNGLIFIFRNREIKVTFEPKNKVQVTTCNYDRDKSILQCNKCGQQQTEWYNDQPGDRCMNHIKKKRCTGTMIRVENKEVLV